MKIKALLTGSLLFVLVTTTLFSCKKDSKAHSATVTSISVLNAPWSTTAWGGINGGLLTATIDSDSATATVTFSGSNTGFAVGDQFFTNILYNAPGKFNAIAKFTYGTNNSISKTRAVILTLQNNNTQLTVDYVATDANFPEVTTVFKKGLLSF